MKRGGVRLQLVVGFVLLFLFYFVIENAGRLAVVLSGAVVSEAAMNDVAASSGLIRWSLLFLLAMYFIVVIVLALRKGKQEKEDDVRDPDVAAALESAD